MRVIGLDEILPEISDKSKVLQAIRSAFIDHSKGRIRLPPPTQLVFKKTATSLAGDCHVKTAYSDQHPYFCVKIATGFYGNPTKGLPVNNGLLMLFSSETGHPLSLFQDEGHLTSIRTAAAGALSAQLRISSTPSRLGIIGTGHQAELQSRWIAASCSISSLHIWGRSVTKARALKAKLKTLGIPIHIENNVADLCVTSDVILTTTPATEPILLSRHIKPGHHIIAMGSDSPGKIELEPAVLGLADVILTDDHEQCLHHGEFGHAVDAGTVEPSCDLSLGHALENLRGLDIATDAISIVDLTGLGAQDLAIASLVYDTLPPIS
jgi:ornithine cyclodeaminase